jgi:hypothetical protein
MKLPHRIFVKIENKGSKEDEYLAAAETAEQLADKDEIVEIAEYKLVEKTNIKLTATVTLERATK